MYRIASTALRATVPLVGAGVFILSNSNTDTTIAPSSSRNAVSTSSSASSSQQQHDSLLQIVRDGGSFGLNSLSRSFSNTVYCESSSTSSPSEQQQQQPEDDQTESSSYGSSSNSSSSSSSSSSGGPPFVDLQPGDFNHKDDEKGFSTHPADGLTLIMQSSVGPPNAGGAFLTQMMLNPSGGQSTVFILMDQKSPTLQAVLQPGPEGAKLLVLKTSLKAPTISVPGLTVEGEIIASAKAMGGGKLTGKFTPPQGDFFTSLVVQPTTAMNGTPPNFEYSYHQTLFPAGALVRSSSSASPTTSVRDAFLGGTFTAGGTLSGEIEHGIAPGAHGVGTSSSSSSSSNSENNRVTQGLLTVAGFVKDTLVSPVTAYIPGVNRLVWETYGSWEASKRDHWVGVRLGHIPRPDGSQVTQMSGKYWHRVNRNLELGTDFTASAQAWDVPGESSMGVGARMNFEGPGGLGPTLTAHVSSNQVASISFLKPSAGPASATFMRTTFTGVFDHKHRDYKAGATVEMFY